MSHQHLSITRDPEGFLFVTHTGQGAGKHVIYILTAFRARRKPHRRRHLEVLSGTFSSEQNQRQGEVTGTWHSA